MPAFASFTTFLAACLLAAAGVYYPVYLGITALAEVPPHKILSRLGMLIAAATLVFLLRRLDLSDRASLGYGLARPQFVRRLLTGWFWGVITMAIPFAAMVVLDVRELQPDSTAWSGLGKAAAGGLFGGLVVGFIEETFFRGALYSGMRRHAGLVTTALASSLLFAALHFIRPEAFAPGEIIGWGSGFTLLFGAFDAFAGLDIWDSFAALVAVGFLLTLVRAWDGSIALAIGLHAGWVLVIKIGKTLTRGVDDSPLAFLTGTYDHVIGWLVTAWLVLLIAFIWRTVAKREQA